MQATAAGVAIALGGAMRDVVAGLAAQGALGPALTGPSAGYGVVYHIEIVLLFATLVAIGPLVRPASEAAPAAVVRGSASPSFPASPAVCGGQAMPTGAITSYIDVAQLVLYAFWLFFAGLIFYLRREDKREGYPLDHRPLGPASRSRASRPCPRPRPSCCTHGGTYTAPRAATPTTARSRPMPVGALARRAAAADRQPDASTASARPPTPSARTSPT